MLLLPLGVSAQEFLKIVEVEYDNVCSKTEWHMKPRFCKNDRKMIRNVLLSNGYYLHRTGDHTDFNWYDSGRNAIKTNIMGLRENFSQDSTFIYHIGHTYWVETVTYESTLMIKSVKVHEVKSETSASLNGDFSYNSFLALWKGIGGGIGRSKGHISGSLQGGTKTIVNLIFENGTFASIEAAADPIWLDAMAGMKVKLYKLRNTKLYVLLL